MEIIKIEGCVTIFERLAFCYENEFVKNVNVVLTSSSWMFTPSLRSPTSTRVSALTDAPTSNDKGGSGRGREDHDHPAVWTVEAASSCQESILYGDDK